MRSSARRAAALTLALASLAAFAADRARGPGDTAHAAAPVAPSAADPASPAAEETLAQAMERASAPSVEAGAAPAPRPLPFPVAIDARFELIDQTGARRTEADFHGRPWLLFFGYARCEAICSVALPRMAETLDLLGPAGEAVTPVLITVDPGRDTPAALAEAAPRIHPRLVALTGAEPALAAARAAFQVSAEVVFTNPAGAPVLSHGSFLYLAGPDGRVMTLLPPVLGPERMAEIVATYL